VQDATRNVEIAHQWMAQGRHIGPDPLALLNYKQEMALQRRADAVDAVKDATGVSAVALLAAGLACGAAAVAPTP